MTQGVTGVTGSEGRSAAERQRAKRARDKAARELLAREAELAPLRLVMAAEAERQMRQVDEALTDEQRGLPAAERLLEGSKALVLALTGNPMLRMAMRAATPVADLARQLQCTRLEAARIQQADDMDLADRLFGKAVQMTRGDGAAPIVVNLVATPGMAAVLNLQSDQALSGEDAA